MLPSLTITIHSHRVLNRFDPSQALGACVDGGEPGPSWPVAAMRSAGLRPLAYRLRTELAGEAWHWNPEGRFSEGRQGYWISDARPSREIVQSYGYRLPRRGNTFDQANDDGYSRITDGDPQTFWKSNPYLDAVNPQWILVRLSKPQTVDALRIRWADPYALRYRVEYWEGQNSRDVDGSQRGVWRTFPNGDCVGKGGVETRRLGRKEGVLWVRLRLLVSSHTPLRPHDARDALGFAVREIEIGRLSEGRVVDGLLHRRDKGQSAVWVSSTDPWHRTVDRDARTEQPGLDRVFRSGLTNGLPVLMPAPVLYDTPENAAALFRWLRARRYAVRGFEMGEEPDGQVCAPEDYATLYLRTAVALRAVNSRVLLGGPGLQTAESDYGRWSMLPPRVRASGRERSWASRFAASLRAQGHGSLLGFLSFEWYPFDNVAGDPSAQLAKASGLLRKAMARQGVPGRVPRLMTEYGYSAYSGPAEVDLPGALLNLDIVGAFLASGGRAAYLYGYPPSPLAEDRKGFWGALAMFLPDGTRLPTYWAARMMTESWCGAARSAALLKADTPDPFLAAYALQRPNGATSVLLLNKDPHRAQTLRLQLDGKAVTWGNLTQYGRAQYAWKAEGADGHPSRDLPPSRLGFSGAITLPPYSATVATFR